MSMTHYIEGIVPPDDTFNKMLAVYDACKLAKVEPPDEVYEFFDRIAPDPSGVILSDNKLNDAVTEWYDESDGRSGYEIDLELLPKHVKKIRAVISW